MSKYVFGQVLNAKICFRMSNAIFSLSSNVKIGFCMSIYDFRPDFEFQNRILNIKTRYSAPV